MCIYSTQGIIGGSRAIQGDEFRLIWPKSSGIAISHLFRGTYSSGSQYRAPPS